MIRYYLRLLDEDEIERLMVFIPPQFGKTEQVTIHHQAYYLEQHPDHNTILASYNQTQANKYSRRIRDIARGRVALSRDRKAVSEWETAARGGLKAIGVNSGVTGNRADRLYIDDPVAGREAADSKNQRDALWDWYNSDLLTRLKPGGQICYIQTRWHEDDLAGRILNSPDAKLWTLLELPALATQDEADVFDDDGELVYKGRKRGESLNPQMYPVYRLRQFKARNERAWDSLYQQRPGRPAGTVWKRAWWRFWKTLPPVWEDLVMSIDPAFEALDDGSYVVIQVWGLFQGKAYLLDQLRQKLDYVQTLDAVRLMIKRWPQAWTKLVERKANGHALISMLNDDGVSGVLPVTPGKMSKEARAGSVAPIIRSGNAILPSPELPGYTWVEADYLDETGKFPNASNDDQVDATYYVLKHWFGNQVAQASDDIIEAISGWYGE